MNLAKRRQRLEMQGFARLDDQAISEVGLPRNGSPRRFACAFATLWLALTAWAFAAGAITTGRLLGAMLVGVALIVVFTDFCIPSFLFQLMTRRSAVRQAGASS